MKQRFAVILGVAAFAALATACGSDAATGNTEGSTVSNQVTVNGSGPVTLQVGQQLVVALASNPTTGYDWLVATAPDVAVLESLGDPSYEPTPVASNVVGSGGTTSIRFDAAAPGSTTVVLRYKRSWEDDTPDDQLVTIDVTVTAG